MVSRTPNMVGIDIVDLPGEKFDAFREHLRLMNVPLNYKNWGQTRTNGTVSCWGYFSEEQVNMMEVWLNENAKEVYRSRLDQGKSADE